jgi:hypothetical protein
MCYIDFRIVDYRIKNGACAMSLRKPCFCLIVLLSLLGAGQLFSSEENIRIVLIEYSLLEEASDAVSRQFLSQINSSLRQDLPKINTFDVLDASAVSTVHELLLSDPRFQGRENNLFLELGRRLRADVVVFGRVSTQDPNRFGVETRLIYVNSPGDTQDFFLDEPRFREINLRGNLVLRITERVQRHFARNDTTTEASIELSRPPRIETVTEPLLQERDMALNVIFAFGYTGDRGMMAGLDFVFAVQRSHFSFGFSAGGMIDGPEVDLIPSVFVEANLFQNDFYRPLQIYFRGGLGLFQPFVGDEKDKRESDIRLLTLAGVRLSAGHFVFDAGLGYDYYSFQQMGVLYLRAGLGFHF